MADEAQTPKPPSNPALENDLVVKNDFDNRGSIISPEVTI